ncbi:ABC transporter ATP-binding protein [Phototrophicus methaneseepsis]|uniref:ABC transporter ATP-binding protein n=1 Tax=Phototrophicus methaneseepsis TaxID=2710758 RepID=A0A7S8EBR1_9CHLR|nr:ABC transporter ATP-binding protein [Phototrophicus methaneseepsis]QPC84070.1 ABC transporter ATP-binding protein [Phototrophicus methaneseepsis]
MSQSDVVLDVKNLSVVYHSPRGDVKATSDVSFQLHSGEALALIGESGCGKTTLSLSLIKMLPGIAEVTQGEVLYTRDGSTRDVLNFNDHQMRLYRWQDCAMVFQGAQNAFNPVLKIKDQFLDTARAHEGDADKIVTKRALELFRLVRLDPQRVLNSYPHELSGGMKQRTLLALGVLLNPQIVILDEPTTALDILTQRAIIDVLNEMQRELGFSIIFISHDLALAAEMADRVATMYAGQIVELGPVNDIFYKPLHPYTLGLLQSVPKLGTTQDDLVSIPGSPPNLINPPSGCKFHPRCPFATEKCVQESPPLVEYEEGHSAACWHTEEVIAAHPSLREPASQPSTAQTTTEQGA